MSALVLLGSTGVLADQFDAQINSLRAQANQQQSQVDALQSQADTLANKVASMNAQIAALQDQISLNQAKSAKLTGEIADAKDQIATKKAMLDESIRAIYAQQQVTPIEMLASSDNFSDYVNKSQGLDDIKTHIQDAVAQIQQLQAQLTAEQTQVTQLLSQQNDMQQSMSIQRQQVQDLLTSTQNNEANYQAQVASSNAQISSLRAQQAAAIAANSRRVSFNGSSNGSGGSCDIGHGNGGYPYGWCNSGQDTEIDAWGMFNRECVSYTAWATQVRFGHYMPYWGGHGNAKQWPGNASADGIPVDHTPHVGDVGIYMGGYYGHAMIVEQVNNNGTVIVSSMNADNNGHFQYDEWSTSALVFIHFR